VTEGGDLRRPALLLAAAFAIHNLEEGLTYAATRGDIAAKVHALGLPWRSPESAVATAALLALTIAGSAAMLWAALGPPNGAKRTAVRALAWVLLANVILPHLPMALILGGYTPGLITAVAVNLPLSLWVLRATRTD
jgi:uncharacterized protein with HXXEE motif